ncbi:MAG: VanZ family protein [Armatimonadota bacterium]|nr:VanZ family protein [Armatimonadota bacterium]
MLRWLPVCLWLGMMLAIFYFSSRAGSPENSAEWIRSLLRWLAPHLLAQLTESQLLLINFLFRKTGHGVGYMLLTLLGYWAMRAGFEKAPKHALYLAALFSLLRAVVDEVQQSFVPERSGTVRDVLIDGVGIALAMWLIRARWRRKQAS